MKYLYFGLLKILWQLQAKTGRDINSPKQQIIISLLTKLTYLKWFNTGNSALSFSLIFVAREGSLEHSTVMNHINDLLDCNVAPMRNLHSAFQACHSQERGVVFIVYSHWILRKGLVLVYLLSSHQTPHDCNVVPLINLHCKFLVSHSQERGVVLIMHSCLIKRHCIYFFKNVAGLLIYTDHLHRLVLY